MKRLITFWLVFFCCSGCEITSTAIKNQIAKQGDASYATLKDPAVKATIIADGRAYVGDVMERAKTTALATYDENAARVYDKAVEGMKNPGIMGVVLAGIGIVLQVAFGAGVL